MILRLKRKTDAELSHAMIGLLVVIGALGLFAFSRELPAVRRYLRIARM
jgi:hypothetical protein